MMSKISLKAGTMIYPLPVVMVSCGKTTDELNIITIAWTGTICTNPPMCYISIRPERYSYEIIKRYGEFVINLPSKELAYATDWCGVKSGKDIRKFKEMNLTPEKGNKIETPSIAEAPVNIECKVKEIIKLGSHDMFLAEVVSVNVNNELFDNETGAIDMEAANLYTYSHGKYFQLGKYIGKFGYSVAKPKTKKRWSNNK